MVASGPSMWSRWPARGATPALLLLLSIIVVQTTASQEGVIGFKATSLVVEENARVAIVTVTRSCAAHSGGDGLCNGHVSVGYTTESPRSVAAPGTVQVLEGSRAVATSTDLRGILMPGDPVRIGWQELRVDPDLPVLASSFTLERSFLGDGNPAFVHRVDNRLPGRCVAVNGSTLVTTTEDARPMLARGELLRVGTFTARVETAGVFNLTHVQLDRALPLEGDFDCFAEHQYSGLADPRGIDFDRVTPTPGSNHLASARDNTDILFPGDILKVGTHTYPVDAVTATTIDLRSAVVDEPLTAAPTIAYFRRLKSTVPGLCRKESATTLRCDHEVRTRISIGDYVRFGQFTTLVVDLPTSNTIELAEPCTTLCPASEGTVAGDHVYALLRGSFNVEDGSSDVETLLDTTQLTTRGDIFKIGPVNYVLDHAGLFNARHLTLQDPFAGRTRNDTTLFLVRPAATATARPNFDYEPSIGRLYFPRSVMSREVLVHLIDDDIDEADLRIPVLLTDARYEDASQLTRGLALGCTFSATSGSSTVQRNTADCTELPLGDLVVVGDVVALHDEAWGVTAVTADTITVNVSATATAEGTLYKLYPSIDAAAATCSITITDDGDKAVSLIRGSFSRNGGTVRVDDFTACSLLRIGDVISCVDVEGSATVVSCSSNDGSLQLSGDTLAGGADFAATKCRRLAQPDNPGAIQFVRATYSDQEAAVTAGMGGLRTAVVSLELERVGGTAGAVVVTLETGDPLSHYAAGSAQGSWGGEDVMLPCVLAVRSGETVAHAPADAPDLTLFLTAGDVLHVEGHVLAVHAVNSTSVVWGEPLNRTMPYPFPGATYDFAPARQLTAAAHQYGFVDEATAPGYLFSGIDLRGRVPRGGFVKVGDHAVYIDPTAAALVEDAGDVGELPGTVTATGSDLDTTVDLRAGFRQTFECYASGGYFRVRCHDVVSHPIATSATMGTLLDTIRDMGYLFTLALSGAATADPVCGASAATATQATITIQAAAFDDEACELDVVRDHLELGGVRGSGVARFHALLGVRRGDFIGTAAGVHRVAQSGQLTATALARDDVVLLAGRDLLTASRVQRVPLDGTSSPGPMLALREPIFTYRGLSWLRTDASVSPQAWHLTVSQDLRPGLRQQLRCRADSGAFQLQLGDGLTAAIAVGASPSDLETELGKLPQVASVTAESTDNSAICGTGNDAVDVVLRFTLNDGRGESLPRLQVLVRTASHATSLALQVAQVPGAARGDAILVHGIPVAVSMDQSLAYNATHLPLAFMWGGGAVSGTPLYRFGASDNFFARDFESLPDTTVVEFPHGVSLVATAIRIVDDGLVEDTETIPLRISRPRRLCTEVNCAIETRIYCTATGGTFALARDGGGAQASLKWDDNEAAVQSAIQAVFGTGVEVFSRTSATKICSTDPQHYFAVVEEVSQEATRPLPFFIDQASTLEGFAYATVARPHRSGNPGWSPPTLGTQTTAVLSLDDAADSSCGTFRVADSNVSLPVPYGPTGASSVIVERTGGAGAPAIVELVTDSGTAECVPSADSATYDGVSADCISVASTLHFGAGVVRMPFPIRTLPDVGSQATKTFKVRLVGVSGRGCALDNAQGEREIQVLPFQAGTVLLRWREAQVQVLESAGTVGLALERAYATGPATVSVTATAATPDAAGRFSLAADSVDFAPGQTVAFVPLRLIDDELKQQGASTLTVDVVGVAGCGTAACNYNTTAATMTVVLEDDDADLGVGVVGFAAANFSGLESSLSVDITLTRLGGASGSVPVRVVAQSLAGAGTDADIAQAGVDFEGVTLDVTLVHGQVEATLAVPLLADPGFGGEERKFEVVVSPGGAAPAGSVTTSPLVFRGGSAFPAATVHVADEDDVPGVLGFTAGSVVVQESSEVAIVTVTRAFGASGTVSVEVETIGVTALAGHPMFPASDYGGIYEGGALPTGVEELSADRVKLTLGEGVTALPFMLRVFDDACAEGKEMMQLRLYNFTVLNGLVPVGCPMGTCQGLNPDASTVNVTISDEGEDQEGVPAALALASAPWKSSAAFTVNCSETDATSSFALEVTLLSTATFPAMGLSCSAGTTAADVESALRFTGASRDVSVTVLTGAAPAFLVEFGDLGSDVISLEAASVQGNANVSVTPVAQFEVRSTFGAALPTLSVQLVDACGAPALALAMPLTLQASLFVTAGNPCLRENLAEVSEVHEVQITPLTKLAGVVSVTVDVGSKLMWLDMGGAAKPATLIDGVTLYIGSYTGIGSATATGGSRHLVFAGDATKVDEFAAGSHVHLNGTSYVVESVGVSGSDTVLYLDRPVDAAAGEISEAYVVRAPYGVKLARTQFQLEGRSCLVGGRSDAPIASSPSIAGIAGADVEIAFTQFTLGNPATTSKTAGVTLGPHLDLGTAYSGDTQSHQPVYVNQDSSGRLALELDQPFEGPPALATTPSGTLSIAADLPTVAVTKGSATVVMSEDLRASGFNQGDSINLKGYQHTLASFPALVPTDQTAAAAGSSLARSYVVKLGTEAFTPNWKVDDVLQIDDIVTFSSTSTDRYRARILPRTDTAFSVDVSLSGTTVNVLNGGTLPSLGVGDRLSFGGAGHVSAHKIKSVTSTSEFVLETDAGTVASTTVTQHAYAFTLIRLSSSATVSGNVATLNSPEWNGASNFAVFPGDMVAVVPTGGDESQPSFHYIVASTDAGAGTVTLETAPSSSGSVSVFLVMFQVALDKAFTGQTSSGYDMLKVSTEATLDRPYEGETLASVQPYDASSLTGTYSLVIGDAVLSGLDSSITASDLQGKAQAAGLSDVAVRRSYSKGGWKWEISYGGNSRDLPTPQLCGNGLCDGAGEVGTAGVLLYAVTRSQGRQVPQPDLAGRVRLPVDGSSCGHLHGTTEVTVAPGSTPRADFSNLIVNGLQEGYHVEVAALTEAVVAVREAAHSKTRPEPLRVTTPAVAITGQQVAAMRVAEHPRMALSGQPLGRQPVIELRDSQSGGSVSDLDGITVRAELVVNHAGEAIGGLGTMRTAGKTSIADVTCAAGSYMCVATSESTKDDIPEYAVAVIDGQPYQVGSANQKSPLWKQRVTIPMSNSAFELYWGGVSGNPKITAADITYADLELEDTSGAGGAAAAQRNAEKVATEVSSGFAFLDFTKEVLGEVVGTVDGTNYVIELTFTSNVALLSATSGTTVALVEEGQRGYFTPDIKVVQLSFTGQTTETAIIGAFRLEVGSGVTEWIDFDAPARRSEAVSCMAPSLEERLESLAGVDDVDVRVKEELSTAAGGSERVRVWTVTFRSPRFVGSMSVHSQRFCEAASISPSSSQSAVSTTSGSKLSVAVASSSYASSSTVLNLNGINLVGTWNTGSNTFTTDQAWTGTVFAASDLASAVVRVCLASGGSLIAGEEPAVATLDAVAGAPRFHLDRPFAGTTGSVTVYVDNEATLSATVVNGRAVFTDLVLMAPAVGTQRPRYQLRFVSSTGYEASSLPFDVKSVFPSAFSTTLSTAVSVGKEVTVDASFQVDGAASTDALLIGVVASQVHSEARGSAVDIKGRFSAMAPTVGQTASVRLTLTSTRLAKIKLRSFWDEDRILAWALKCSVSDPVTFAIAGSPGTTSPILDPATVTASDLEEAVNAALSQGSARVVVPLRDSAADDAVCGSTATSSPAYIWVTDLPWGAGPLASSAQALEIKPTGGAGGPDLEPMFHDVEFSTSPQTSAVSRGMGFVSNASALVAGQPAEPHLVGGEVDVNTGFQALASGGGSVLVAGETVRVDFWEPAAVATLCGDVTGAGNVLTFTKSVAGRLWPGQMVEAQGYQYLIEAVPTSTTVQVRDDLDYSGATTASHSVSLTRNLLSGTNQVTTEALGDYVVANFSGLAPVVPVQGARFELTKRRADEKETSIRLAIALNILADSSSPIQGSYRLQINAEGANQITPRIYARAEASEVESALKSLPNLRSVSVTREISPDADLVTYTTAFFESLGVLDYVITFPTHAAITLSVVNNKLFSSSSAIQVTQTKGASPSLASSISNLVAVASPQLASLALSVAQAAVVAQEVMRPAPRAVAFDGFGATIAADVGTISLRALPADGYQQLRCHASGGSVDLQVVVGLVAASLNGIPWNTPLTRADATGGVASIQERLEGLWHELGEAAVDATGHIVTRAAGNTNDLAQWLAEDDEVGLSTTASCSDATSHTVSTKVGAGRPTAATVSISPPSTNTGATVLVCLRVAPRVDVASRRGQKQLCQPYGSDLVLVRVRKAHSRALGDFSLTASQGASMTGNGGSSQTLTCTSAAPDDVEFHVRYRGAASATLHGGWQGAAALAAVESAILQAGTMRNVVVQWCSTQCTKLCQSSGCCIKVSFDDAAAHALDWAKGVSFEGIPGVYPETLQSEVAQGTATLSTVGSALVETLASPAELGGSTTMSAPAGAAEFSSAAALAPSPGLALRTYLGAGRSLQYTATCRATTGTFSMYLGGSETMTVDARDVEAAVQGKWDTAFPDVAATVTITPTGAPACTATGLSTLRIEVTTYRGVANADVSAMRWVPKLEGDGSALDGCESVLLDTCTASVTQDSGVLTLDQACVGAEPLPGDLLQVNAFPAVVSTVSADGLTIALASPYRGPTKAGEAVYLSWTRDVQLRTGELFSSSHPMRVAPGAPGSIPVAAVSVAAGTTLITSLPSGHGIRVNDTLRVGGVAHVVKAVDASSATVDPPFPRDLDSVPLHVLTRDPALSRATELRVVSPPGATEVTGATVTGVDAALKVLTLAAATDAAPGEVMYVAFKDGRYASFIVAAVAGSTVTATRPLPDDAARTLVGSRVLRAAGHPRLSPAAVLTLADASMVPSGHDVAVAEAADDRVVQTLRCTATSGSFRLRLGLSVTAAIAADAKAADVQTALEALADVGAGNVVVTYLDAFAPGVAAVDKACAEDSGTFVVVEILSYKGVATAYDGADRWAAGDAPHVPPLAPMQWELQGGAISRLAPTTGEAGLRGQTRVALTDGVAVFPDIALRSPGVGAQIRFRLLHAGGPPSALVVSPRLFVAASIGTGPLGVELIEPGNGFMSADSAHGLETRLRILDSGDSPASTATTQVVVLTELADGTRVPTNQGNTVFTAVDGVVTIPSMTLDGTGTVRKASLLVFQWNPTLGARTDQLGVVPATPLLLRLAPAALSFVVSPAPLTLNGEFTVAPNDTVVAARVGGSLTRPPAKVMQELGPGDAVQIGGQSHTLSPVLQRTATTVSLSSAHKGSAVNAGPMLRLPTAGRPLPVDPVIHMLDSEGNRVGWDNTSTVRVGVAYNSGCPSNELWSPRLGDSSFDGRLQLLRCSYDSTLTADMWGFSLTLPGEALAVAVTPLTTAAELAAAVTDWAPIGAARVSFLDGVACKPSNQAPATIAIEFTNVDTADLPRGIVPRMRPRFDRLFRFTCTDTASTLALSVQGRVTNTFTGASSASDLAAVASLEGVVDGVEVLPSGTAAVCDAASPPQLYLHVRGVVGGGLARVEAGTQAAGKTVSAERVTLDGVEAASDWASLAGTKPSSLLHIQLTVRASVRQGIATPRGLHVKEPCTGLQLQAWGDSTLLTASTVSGAFDVYAGAAAGLRLADQPALARAGVGMAVSPAVHVVDVAGNRVPDMALVVNASLANFVPRGDFENPAPAGALSGLTGVATTAGAATFTSLGLTQPAVQAQLEFTSTPPLPARVGMPHPTRLMSKPFPVAGPPRRLRLVEPWTTALQYARDGSDTTQTVEIELAVEVTDLSGLRSPVSTGADGGKMGALQASILEDPFCPQDCTSLSGDTAAMVVSHGRVVFKLRLTGLPTSGPALRAESQWVRVASTDGAANEPDGGSFRLAIVHAGYRYQTRDLAHDASNAAVKQAVEELPLALGPVTVLRQPYTPHGGTGTTEWRITFAAGVGNVPQLQPTAVQLTRGGAACSATVVAGAVVDGAAYRLRIRGAYDTYPLVVDTEPFGVGDP